MIELRYWIKDHARARYESLCAAGFACNMAADGRGVIVRYNLGE